MKESLLLEWDYEKNGNVDPASVKDHSNKKFFWICPKGHPSYLMPVTKRSIGHGCPVCSNHKIIKGINDFETTNPELMQEWFWEENNKEGVDPSTFSSGSSRLAWWKCKKCGNTWRASISNRTRIHSGCPYCANLKVKKGFNDLATLRPDLAKEWYQEKNGDLTPDEVVEGYAKKVWWKCRNCGNVWEATPNARKRRGCPYCCNHVKIAGFNDFESQYPELAKEWDYEKNKKAPSQYAAGADTRVWWRCDKGHSWRTAINVRTKGCGCPYCGNKKVLVGFNDLFSAKPELKEEWDFERNKELSPYDVTTGSTKKAWWICKECGHSWNAAINTRVSGYGCPECGRKKSTISRLKTMAAKNPLFEQYPELLKEWDFEKNTGIDISLLPVSSNRYAWWKCEKGHSFRQSISSRTNNKVGCPYCHGQKVLTGVNDLQTLNPGLAAEWDFEKNYPLTPSDVFSHAAKHVWWKCSVCGNTWKAKIHNRANGRGCPVCNDHGTSFIEQALFFYIKQAFPDAENRYDFDGTELDIYIPSKKTAIEYDGSYFHSMSGAEDRENRKDKFCRTKGIRIVRLREKPLEPTKDATNISCDCSTWPLLETTCRELLKELGFDKEAIISIRNDYPDIIESERLLIRKNAFGMLYPPLLDEWDYEKNKPLLPDYFSRGSNQKVWWKCKNGHSWQAQISNRCNGSGCPKCRIKPVVMLDPETLNEIKRYGSTTQASKDLGITSSNILAVCKGQRNLAGGYRWKFVEEECC